MTKLKAFAIASSSKKTLERYELGNEIIFFNTRKAAQKFLDGCDFPCGQVVVEIEITIKN